MAPPYGINFPLGEPRTAPAQGGGYGGRLANVRGYGGESVPHVIIAAGNFDAVGVMPNFIRSTDGGVTWSTVATFTTANRFTRVAYSPTHRRFVAIGAGADFAFSDDFGETWTEVIGGMPASGLGGSFNFTRLNWDEQAGLFMTGDLSGVHPDWLIVSADGLIWSRINTGIATAGGGSTGVAFHDGLGLWGFGTTSPGGTARLIFSPDLVAFAERSVVGPGGSWFQTITGANGGMGDICATPARFICSCIAISAFNPAYLKNSADGVIVSPVPLALGNNADCCSAAYNPDADRVLVQLSNSAGQYGRSDDQGATWQVGALGIADPGTNVNCEYLPRAGKWFITQRALAAQPDRIVDSETGNDNDWTRRVTPAFSLYGIAESS